MKPLLDLDIAAPPARAFGQIAEQQNIPTWTANIKEARYTSEGTVVEGPTIWQRHQFGKQQMEATRRGAWFRP